MIDHRARGITLYYEIIFQGVYRSPLSFGSSISDLNVDNNLGAKTDFSVLRLYYTREYREGTYLYTFVELLKGAAPSLSPSRLS